MRLGGRPLLFLVVILWGAAALRDGVNAWITNTELPRLDFQTSDVLRDRNETLLRVYTVADGRWRLAVDASKVDPGYIRMLTTYEDRRFFAHSGVDYRALMRATWQSLGAGRIVSGGSTLTMQVARLLENSGTGSFHGKLRQIRLALALECNLTKDDILNLYLALAPMGGNLEGIRAASLSYFAKEPNRLTPAQSALLVALPQSPEARRPDRFPDAARAARNRVLDRSVQYQALTPEEARTAKTESAPVIRHPFPALAPHLSDLARAGDGHHPAPQGGHQSLTLDGDLQARLETLVVRASDALSDRLSIAMLVADHQTGEILASLGSAGFHQQGQGFVDMTRAIRSPGSTLKPLIYGLAFDQGMAHPETLIDDRPLAFDGYAPQNFDGEFRGQVTVAEALRLSLNLPAVQLTEAIGPQNLIAALRRAGADPVVPGGKPGLAVALGGLGLTLGDLVQLYAGIANEGVAQPIYWRATPATSPAQTASRILTRASAWQIGDILSRMAPPLGAPANRLAYKTGTSYGHRDAWAIGFDGAHVIGVWLGRPDGTPVPGAFGGDLAAPLLFDAFALLKSQFTPLRPPPPETLMVSGANLPDPLRIFRQWRGRVTGDHPALIFPPDGAVLAARPELPAKVRDGRPPFTWMANGAPIATDRRTREVILTGLGQGYNNVTVIDAEGRSSRVTIQLK